MIPTTSNAHDAVSLSLTLSEAIFPVFCFLFFSMARDAEPPNIF